MTVFNVSAQEWWNDTVTKFFSHLHTEVAFPHKQTLSGRVPFDIRSVVHNVPPGAVFYKLMVQAYWSNDLPLNDRPEDERLDYDRHAYALMKFKRDPYNAPVSGGTLADNGMTAMWNDTLIVDCDELPYSGWVQFRLRGFVRFLMVMICAHLASFMPGLIMASHRASYTRHLMN